MAKSKSTEKKKWVKPDVNPIIDKPAAAAAKKAPAKKAAAKKGTTDKSKGFKQQPKIDSVFDKNITSLIHAGDGSVQYDNIITGRDWEGDDDLIN